MVQNHGRCCCRSRFHCRRRHHRQRSSDKAAKDGSASGMTSSVASPRPGASAVRGLGLAAGRRPQRSRGSVHRSSLALLLCCRARGVVPGSAATRTSCARGRAKSVPTPGRQLPSGAGGKPAGTAAGPCGPSAGATAELDVIEQGLRCFVYLSGGIIRSTAATSTGAS